MGVNGRTNRRGVRALVGGCLMHFSAGICCVWGNAGIYALSYFHHIHNYSSSATGSLILLLAVLSFSVLVGFATKLIRAVGFTTTIRSCAVIILFSQVPVYLCFTLLTMMIFYMIIPAVLIYVSLMPSTTCLYQYYPDYKSKIKQLNTLSLGLGAIVWNIVFLHVCNPNNVAANQIINGISYLPSYVVGGFQQQIAAIFFTCTLCFFLGAFLLTQKQHSSTLILYVVGQQQLEIPPQLHQQIKICDRMRGDTSAIFSQKQQITIWQALKNKRCLLIFFLLFIIDMFPIYLTSNFKTIFLPLFNNDYLLGYCLVVYTTAKIIGNPCWNFVFHRGGISCFMFAVVSFSLLASSLVFMLVHPAVLVVFLGLMGLSDSGVEMIAGPGIVDILDLRLTTQFMPFREVSMVLGFIITPILQMLTNRLFTPYSYLLCLFSFTALSFLIGLYYYASFPHKRENVTQRVMKRFQRKKLGSQIVEIQFLQPSKHRSLIGEQEKINKVCRKSKSFQGIINFQK